MEPCAPNVLGSNTTDGVDFDTYNISSRLTAGDTTAQTTYASGGDLVLLSVQIISVTNNPVADLTITKSHTGDFSAGQQNTFNLTATNTGPLATDIDTVVAGDQLPTGMTLLFTNVAKRR